MLPTLTAEISLTQFARNLSAIRAKTQKKLFSVIKANAYGHGAVGLLPVVQQFSDVLCVATLSEARELAENGVIKPILIFSPLSDIALPVKSYPNFIPTVCDVRDVIVFQKHRLATAVALKINTGLNRTGVLPREVPLALNLIRKAGFRLHSVFSHLYNTFDLESAKRQLSLFLDLTQHIPSSALRHIAATGSLFLPPEFTLDAVRPGLALYGYGSSEVAPIATVSAPVLKSFTVSAGEHISYGNYISPRNMRIAVLPAGYADGIRRKADPRAENRFVLVKGVLCPIVGQICMDITLADMTNAKTAIAGDPAYFIGDGITAEQPANACNTNVYEILTAIFSGRIQRIYHGEALVT